ncbi:hypothetical protein swp_2786 [Shewanella piezotolerans WP3]|uniref:Uncharacterized protein n=1 Tax=Shewanella piezotolerans (strain WP3 / JCM 13877) TaxID=225849 RepID=B8CPD6_SHEPW|nr:hypothetical protein swp_2786 [Shewanella piezotolerans WP3]
MDRTIYFSAKLAGPLALMIISLLYPIISVVLLLIIPELPKMET